MILIELLRNAAAEPKSWTVAVARRLNGEGFLITCYLTAVIKKGTEIWKRK